MAATQGNRARRVMVVADHAISRRALAALLDGCDGIGEVEVADEAASPAVLARARSCDVVLLALASGGEAVTAVRLLHEAPRVPPVLVLSGDGPPAFVRAAFAAGAGGVITTAAGVAELVGALDSVAGGASYLHPSLGAVLAQVDTARVIDDLSAREREVLRLIALGLTNPEIAQTLVVSVRTVETHRAHVSHKLHAQTRADLVRHALENGLLTGAL